MILPPVSRWAHYRQPVNEPRPIATQGLSTAWERRVIRVAVVTACGAWIVSVIVALGLWRGGLSPWLSIPASVLVAWATYAFATRKLRRRRRILAEPANAPGHFSGSLAELSQGRA